MPPRTRKRPHVALIIETSKVYGRELLLGISHYAQLHGPWEIFASERGQADPDPPWLAGWVGDGIITRSVNLKNCRAARDRGVPVVSLRHLLDKPEFPSLFPDQDLISQRIAGHFLERGFRQFAYIGITGPKGWERSRREAFVRFLKLRGMTEVIVRATMADPGLSWEREIEQIALWIKTLPLPIGIMVNFDFQGLHILDACRRAGVRVPDDVAVVSVDNDPVLCEIATPPLSSVNQNVQRIGFEAAAMLDRMMRRQKVETKNYFFEPGQVIVRQSSDVMAVSDERIAKAVRYIRENACAGVDVNAVARAAGLSRRALEKKLLAAIGRTPLEEIQEIRLRKVRQLLLETDYTLSRVAEMSGFQYQEYLVRFFKKRTGLTPGQFRRQTRFGS